MKARIIKCDRNGEIWYEVQKKILFFWVSVETGWGESTEAPFPMWYETLEEAQKVRDNYLNGTKKTIIG